MKGDLEDAIVVGGAIYVAGGKGKKGFVLRSNDGGESFDVFDASLPAVMRALIASGESLLVAGDGKRVFRFPLA